MADELKQRVLQAVLGRFPEHGKIRDIALTGPQVVVQVVGKSPRSVMFKVETGAGPRYFEVTVSERM